MTAKEILKKQNELIKMVDALAEKRLKKTDDIKEDHQRK